MTRLPCPPPAARRGRGHLLRRSWPLCTLLLCLGAPVRAEDAPFEGEESPTSAAPEAGVAEDGMDDRQATVVDRVVAAVGDQIITASDVLVEAALSARSPSRVAPLQAARADPLNALVDRAILSSLAGRASVYQPDSDELKERIRALEDSFEDPRERADFEAALGLDGDRLTAAMSGLLIAEHYVHRNVGLSLPTGAGPDAYIAAYGRWMAERRSRARVRIIEPQDQP